MMLDVSLRDGSHSMRHAFTEQQVRDIAEVWIKQEWSILKYAHGDGLRRISVYNTVFQM